MYLRNYLEDIPLKALKAIADTLSISVEYRARIKLLNAIDRAFWANNLVERTLANLEDTHKVVLSLIAFSFSRGITERELTETLEHRHGFSHDRARQILDDLIPLCLLYGVMDEEPRFRCFSDTGKDIRRFLADGAFTMKETVEPFTPGSPLMEDVYSFLATAYTRGIPLTLKGHVKKKVIETVFEGSRTCSDPTINCKESDRIAIVTDYLKERGLVVFDGSVAYPARLLGGWLDLSITDRYRDIVSFVLTYCLTDSTAITTTSGILAELPEGASIKAERLAHLLHTATPAHGGFQRHLTNVRKLLGFLAGFGLLVKRKDQYLVTTTGLSLWSGETIGYGVDTSSTFMVQPTFDIILGPEAKPRLRFMLELMAVRTNRDTVLTYTITQDSIARARDRGMSTHEVLRFFETHSRNPLPQNVRFSIEDWSNLYGSIFFDQVTLLRFRDAKACDSVVHSPICSPYIRERLSETTLVVSLAHVAVLTAALKSDGYLPERFGETPADPVLEPEAFTTAAAPQHSVESLDVRGRFILPEKILPTEET